MYKVLARFDEVTKLLSSEFSISDIIPENVENLPALVFFLFFLSFMEKKPPTKFYGVWPFFRNV